MIVAKVGSKKSLKGGEFLKGLFTKANKSKSGVLNADEFREFSNLLAKSMKTKYGGAYELTDEQVMVRFNNFDLRSNDGVSLTDFK